jgi:hypothetical protein
MDFYGKRSIHLGVSICSNHYTLFIHEAVRAKGVVREKEGFFPTSSYPVTDGSSTRWLFPGSCLRCYDNSEPVQQAARHVITLKVLKVVTSLECLVKGSTSLGSSDTGRTCIFVVRNVHFTWCVVSRWCGCTLV